MSDDLLNNGLYSLQAWYADTVREYADDYRRRVKEKEFVAADILLEDIEQTCDSAHCVIYTREARVVCLINNNSDAYEENVGEKPPTIESQAYYALRNDILEALGDLEELLDTEE